MKRLHYIFGKTNDADVSGFVSIGKREDDYSQAYDVRQECQVKVYLLQIKTRPPRDPSTVEQCLHFDGVGCYHLVRNHYLSLQIQMSRADPAAPAYGFKVAGARG
jgi:hypothetical protein